MYKLIMQLQRRPYFFHKPSIRFAILVQLDGNRLVLCVVGEGCLAEFSTNATLFVTSEGELVVQHVVAVHPNSSGLQSVGNADGSVEVLGVDGGSKTVS